jgi:uncharacterized membrane protein YbhN (UPF0104 family)
MILRTILRLAIFVAVLAASYLLVRTLRQYSVAQICAAMLMIPISNLALSLMFSSASYATLSLFDALAVRYVGKPLKLHQTVLASFISLAIGHNVGVAALSSAAVRYKFYSRWGLSSADVGLVVLFCGTTVALGLATLGAAAMALRPQDAEAMIGLGRPAIVSATIAAGLVPVIYVALAALLRRPVRIRGRDFRLPTLRIAVLQVIVGTLNFAFVAASLHQMLSALSEASYLKVAAVSIIANVTAIISHVPGGIGILELTVSHILPGAEALAAVIAFRVIYYFIPLALGLLLFAVVEFAGLSARSLEEKPR